MRRRTYALGPTSEGSSAVAGGPGLQGRELVLCTSAPAYMLGLAVDDHDVLRVACPGVELQPFPQWPIGLAAREGDERAVGVGLAGDPSFREVDCDVVPNILPAADGLVRFCDVATREAVGMGGGGGWSR
jgi:hypothetical protein